MKSVILTIALAITTFAQTSTDKRPEQIYQDALPSIVTLKIETKTGKSGNCTGFLALKDGLAVTSHHCIRNARRVIARFANGEEFATAGLVDQDDTRDIAIIKIKTFGKPLLSVAPVSATVGAKAYAIGAPKGFEFSISDGLLSQIQNVDGYNQYQVSCPLSRGNSGGPVFNAQGTVIGVVSWGRTDGQNLNFATPSTYVLGLDTSLPTQTWESLPVTPEPSESQTVNTQEPPPAYDSLESLSGTYTGPWASNTYNVSGTLALSVSIVAGQPIVQAVFTGSEYLNQDTLLVKLTPIGQGVWKMDYTGKKSKISGTGLFRNGQFVGDYRFRKLLWVDKGEWNLRRN